MPPSSRHTAQKETDRQRPARSLTQRIAAVLGPSLLAVTSTETINLDIWNGTHPTLVYLNGLVFFVGGLVVVTSHSRWARPAEMLVTIAGWLPVTAGLFRMAAPTAPQLGPGVLTYTVIGCLAVLGAALAFIAWRERNGS